MEVDYDVLLSIAEIAAAFAGFAALAGVIGGRSAESEQYDFERLRSVVLASLVVVFASILPIVLSKFTIGDISSTASQRQIHPRTTSAFTSGREAVIR